MAVLIVPAMIAALFFGALAAGAPPEPGLPIPLRWWGVAAMSGVTFSLAFLGAPLALAGMFKARRHGRGDLAILYLLVALFALFELPFIYLALHDPWWAQSQGMAD
jgi:hypothetical protein